MKKIKLYSINIFLIGILFLILEFLTGNYVFRQKIDCAYLLCNRKFVYNVDFHHNLTNYQIVYQRDMFGFRDREKKLEDIDILIVGGSTTDERFLKDNDTWSKKLEKKLKLFYNFNFDIVNAGIDGQSTNGHVWNFDKWFVNLENFSPNFIFFYIGINDILYETIENYKKKSNHLKKIDIWEKIKNLIKKNQGIFYKSYLVIYRKFLLNDKYSVTHSDLRKNVVYQIPTLKLEIKEKTKLQFITNLDDLYKKTKKLNSIPIFITQKTLRGTKIKNKIYSRNNFDYFSYEKEVARIITNFCKEKKIYCIDINKKFDFDLNDTYDLVHLSPSGAEKLSDLIFNELKEIKDFNFVY